jgi:hypothetical protein
MLARVTEIPRAEPSLPVVDYIIIKYHKDKSHEMKLKPPTNQGEGKTVGAKSVH